VTTITKNIVDELVPNFMGRFLGERKTKFVFRYDRQRDVEVTVKFHTWLTIYHSIKRLEIATISSSGTSLVGKTTGRECWYEFCCLGPTPCQYLIFVLNNILYIFLKTFKT